MHCNNAVARFIAFSLALAIVFVPYSSAISSDKAKDVAALHIKQGADDVAALEPYSLQKPVEHNGKGYWIAFLQPRSTPSGIYSPTFLKFAVLDEDGRIVRDPEILRILFLHDYKYHLENTFLRSEKISYADLQISLEALSENVANAKANFDGLAASVSKREHSTALDDKLAAIEQQLGELSYKVANLKTSNVRNGLDFENEFSQNSLISSYDSAISNYNSTFEALIEFLDAYESYRLLVRDSETFAMLSSDEQSVLQKISVLEPSIPTFAFSSNLFRQTTAEYNRRLFQDSGRAVNDSVEGTLYRIAEKNAQDAFTGAQSAVETEIATATQNPLEYKTCELGDRARDLKTSWESIKAVIQGKSASTTQIYEDLPRNVSIAASEAESIRQTLESCLNAPKPTPKPSQDAGALTNVFAAVIFIALCAYVYLRWKKSQEQVEDL